jgi:glycosyltransferase involved in cell wall biosynthesis
MISKKIIIILPNLSGGGAERLHVNLANDWVCRGYDVYFILLKKKGELISLLSHKIIIIDLDVSRLRKSIIPLKRHIKKIQPDIVLAAMWPLTSIAVISWILTGFTGKLFLSEHENLSASYLSEFRVSPFYLKSLIRITYPIASGVIAVSKGVKNDLCKLGKLSDNIVQVIYNPVCSNLNNNTQYQGDLNSLWGNNAKIRILSIGRLTEQKDHATLIRAFANLPESFSASLVILGEGSLREELKKLIISLGLQKRVHMPGFIIDPKPWFLSANLFALSSKWEGFGNVIVEALEYGLPIVSTDCPSGPAEILEDGKFGILVPVGDSIYFSKAIVQSLNLTHNTLLLKERALDFSISKKSVEYLDYMSLN